MKIYKRQLIFGGALLIFAIFIFWIFSQIKPNNLKIIIATIIFMVGFIAVISSFIKQKTDLQTNQPEMDELSVQIKLHAGYQAFLASMYLWMAIFVINGVFSSNEEMLGVGILGSAILYGLFILYYKSTGNFSDEK